MSSNSVNILLDLSFVSNIRYLDQYELYLSDQVELQNTLPFASGQAMARGILDSLMSATYFNASALRLLRLLVTSEGGVFYTTILKWDFTKCLFRKHLCFSTKNLSRSLGSCS